jgi:hypothetical protein
MRTIQVGICVLIAFAVLAFGGAEAWGEAILEIGAAVLLVLWGGDCCSPGATRDSLELALPTRARPRRICGLASNAWAFRVPLRHQDGAT